VFFVIDWYRINLEQIQSTVHIFAFKPDRYVKSKGRVSPAVSQPVLPERGKMWGMQNGLQNASMSSLGKLKRNYDASQFAHHPPSGRERGRIAPLRGG